MSNRARHRRDKRREALELAHEDRELTLNSGERVALDKPWPLLHQPPQDILPKRDTQMNKEQS